MRVLARREPVDRRSARLVVAPIRAVLRPPVETKAHAAPSPIETAVETAPSRPVSPQAARAAARRAAKRRRAVLTLIALANAVVIGLAAASVITRPWVAAPAGVLVAWLVACRLSVKAERRSRTSRSAIEIGLPPETVEPEQDDSDVTGELEAIPTPPQPRASPAASAPAVLTGEIPIITESIAGGWDMVPTTLPTYVTKQAAPQRRTVATIDLDSTGVWSSGRNDEDSALARTADETAKATRDGDDARRASGA